MSVQKHVHKYKREDMGSAGRPYLVYRCVLDCTHYIRADLLRGKKAICWRCGKEFIISYAQRKMTKPHCTDCIVRKPVDGKPALTDEQIRELVDVDDIDTFMKEFRP